MKRNYLKAAGQSLTVTINGESGTGKANLADKIYAMLKSDGLIIDTVAGVNFERLTVIAPTARQAQNMYLETLDDQQRETLRGHLAALGYEQ